MTTFDEKRKGSIDHGFYWFSRDGFVALLHGLVVSGAVATSYLMFITYAVTSTSSTGLIRGNRDTIGYTGRAILLI